MDRVFRAGGEEAALRDVVSMWDVQPVFRACMGAELGTTSVTALRNQMFGAVPGRAHDAAFDVRITLMLLARLVLGAPAVARFGTEASLWRLCAHLAEALVQPGAAGDGTRCWLERFCAGPAALAKGSQRRRTFGQPQPGLRRRDLIGANWLRAAARTAGDLDVPAYAEVAPAGTASRISRDRLISRACRVTARQARWLLRVAQCRTDPEDRAEAALLFVTRARLALDAGQHRRRSSGVGAGSAVARRLSLSPITCSSEPSPLRLVAEATPPGSVMQRGSLDTGLVRKSPAATGLQPSGAVNRFFVVEGKHASRLHRNPNCLGKPDAMREVRLGDTPPDPSRRCGRCCKW